MIRGGWAFRLPPLPGELLSSCLARNAFAHGTTPYRFFAMVRPGSRLWNRDIDRDPACLGDLDELAACLGATRDAVEEATLVRLRLLLGTPRLRPDRGDSSFVLSTGVANFGRMLHALQFCPDCLAEGRPFFRREWRLAFSVACGAHGGRALLGACPRCGAVVVPHRSLTTRLTDCHACGRPILGDAGSESPFLGSGQGLAAEGALRLQRRLAAALPGLGRDQDAGAPPPLPWKGVELFDAVRTLVGVAANPQVHARLRPALGLGLPTLPAAPSATEHFERSRLAGRTARLETVEAWTVEWPDRFREAVGAACLTRRAFARWPLPGPLADEVARLPEGYRIDRTWKPVLEEPRLKRLRRTDRAAYRAERARRILAAAGGGG